MVIVRRNWTIEASACEISLPIAPRVFKSKAQYTDYIIQISANGARSGSALAFRS